ncbi:MAG: aldehyde dehydrogenase family protein [Bacteriovorax sp.]|jgi:acyl-CoA reductase-like NAD-dependent aldehyde dehydrogenase
MKILNPATNAVIKDVAEDSKNSVTEKFELSKNAQKVWATKSLDDRLKIIGKFSELLEADKENLAKDLTSEMGKPLQESLNEINGAMKRISFFMENSKKWLCENNVNTDGNTKEVLSFDALGVIGNISAWNYPFLVGVNVFIPALIAGNAVLYKPSEFATLTGLNIARLMHEAGVPKDIFTAVVGDYKAGEAMLDLPLDGYFFTGSFKTGKYIAEKVAHKLVPVGLELGGKDPLYVTDDVSDIRQVAGAVAEGVLYNNGQSCCAVERVYVNEKVYEEFMTHFITEIKNFTTGAITRPLHLEFLDSQIQDAVQKGAKVLCGGKKIKSDGNYFEPTVLVDVNHKMKIMMEETFGPLIGVMKVKSDEEAVKLMNDCEYGLTASVYSKNIERAKKIAGQIDSGTSYINCCDRVSPYLPWSGRKNSGMGSTLSYLGILAFTKPRGWHIRS